MCLCILYLDNNIINANISTRKCLDYHYAGFDIAG